MQHDTTRYDSDDPKSAESIESDALRTTELHFAYATDPPDFERFDVKTLVPGELLGEPCAFAVIGQSHLVSAPALGYHEVCSCDSLSAAASETTTLDPGESGRVAFESESVRATTTVRVESLAAFPGPADADAAHRFGPDAWTTVTVADDGTSYETYHTYPERNASVWTRTELTRIGDDTGDESATPTEDGSATAIEDESATMVEDGSETREGER